ncbi:MAG: choice-of-anchor J domain-containing protein, partial [Phaeodactylibacter sp.]|nr:choice-of-anchor J domain-containing protein [Phaeodactylibacter sp.]
MKNTVTYLLLCTFFSVSSLHAQIIFQEDFESGSLPTGWTVESSTTDGGWQVGSTGALSSQFFNIQSNGSSNIAATNDDACNCNKSNEYLISPAIDLTDQTAVVLSFDAFYTDDNYQGDQEDATIEISVDGNNWVVLEDLHGHGSWDRHSIDISDYAGETIYVGFRYDDDGGWLYGFAIDNVVVEVPPALEVSLAELEARPFGEVGKALSIAGTIYNAGLTPLSSVEISYTVDGDNEVVEVVDNLDIPSFSYHHFELSNPWVPDAAGIYTLDVAILSANGSLDANADDNVDAFETEIFGAVVVPNKLSDFLSAAPVIDEVASASDDLNLPTDLDFFPILGKDELWVVNQRTENEGGTTLTISNATTAPSNFLLREDGNAWHFMSLPTGIAFSSDNFNFATSPGVQDANHSGGTFTGPTLWSSDPEIYAQPSGGNGSHLDMLHGSPYSMGIAHEVDNVFWVYDDWNNDIVRYDFVEDHGPGNDDHSDAIVRRYKNIGIQADADIPNHLVLDKSSGWLYFVDNGNDRVLRLDINSGAVTNALPLINEELAEHSQMGGFTYEVII